MKKQHLYILYADASYFMKFYQIIPLFSIS